jgi:hypothetical protein
LYFNRGLTAGLQGRGDLQTPLVPAVADRRPAAPSFPPFPLPLHRG